MKNHFWLPPLTTARAVALTMEWVSSTQWVLTGEQVLAVATAAGIPVVSLSETLPEGQDYVSWMTENLTALSEALHS